MAVREEFDVTSGGHELTLEFTGGDVVARENVYVYVSDANCRGAGTVTKRFPVGDLGVAGSTIAAGTNAEVSVGTVCPAAASQLDLSATEVTVSWVPSDDSSGNVLYRWRGPAA